eukprot:543297-Rhodomonas_salina.2
MRCAVLFPGADAARGPRRGPIPPPLYALTYTQDIVCSVLKEARPVLTRGGCRRSTLNLRY